LFIHAENLKDMKPSMKWKVHRTKTTTATAAATATATAALATDKNSFVYRLIQHQSKSGKQIDFIVGGGSVMKIFY
tara:strand:- start:246 stop:473 length:228 start_codon:yes stop_codon:yes gene_type:complete